MDKRLWILSFLALAPLGTVAQTPAPSAPPAQGSKAPQATPAKPPTKPASSSTSSSNPFDSGPGGPAQDGGGGGGFDFMGMGTDQTPAKPAWQQFKLPKKTLGLNFKNASADSVLATFSKASGITIIKDPTLTQTLSIYSPKALSLNDAFNLLNETLKLRGFDLKKQGNLMEVVPASKTPDFSAMFKNGNPFGGGGRQPVLKYYPIQYASASAVAKTINDVFSTTPTSGGNPFGGPFGRGGGFQQMIAAVTAGGQNGNQAQVQVHASADDFSNTVIVNAPSNVQSQIEDMLKAIDKQASEPYTSIVYKLKYASSDDLASVVQNVLTANAPTGRGGGAGNVDPFQRFQQAARLGSSQASFGTVVSEPRSNSLIVTGTPENQKLVADVIDRLDQPIKFEDSAVVIPLSSAKADQVAYVINQAFQSKVANTSSTTLSNYGAGNNGGSSLNRWQSQGVTRNTGPSGLADPNNVNNNLALSAGGATADSARSTQTPGAAPQQQAATDPVTAAEQAMVEQAVGDPNVDPMALETNIAVQGGFLNRLFGGGGQGNSSQQTAPIQSRDPNGNITNVHNLSGNVTVIPDVNSNSVIVVTNPENMVLVREILDQLDRTPAQVMIQTIIVEATLGKDEKYGVEWNYLGQKFGTFAQNFGLQSSSTSPTATLPVGFSDTISNGRLTAFLQAIGQDTKFKVLETPRIFAANNNAAEINVSQSIPYVVSSQVDVNGNYNYTYNFENVGVVLDVLPQITANGMVNMQVQQTANELVSYTSFNAPIVNQRSANTVVSVKDGETIVLGGIMGDEKTSTINKIPLLGDIPIIGNLFRSTVKNNAKTELLIFLTPHIVSTPADGDRLREKTEQEMPLPDRIDLDKAIKQQQQTAPSNPPKEGGH